MSSDQVLAATTARYSDGMSARAVQVKVHLTGSALEIFEPGAVLPKRWSLAHVHPATSLSAESRDVLLRPTPTSTDGASLFVHDSVFISALAGAAPHLTARAQRMRVARPLMAIAASIIALVGIGFYLGWSPARWVAASLPDSFRHTMGDGAVQSLTGGKRACTKPDGRAALDTLMRRLTGPDITRFKVAVVDWGLVNAFAAPGERIVLTRGTLFAASSPEEIAGVIAHELGHAEARDPETGIVRALGLTALIELISGGNSGAIANVGLMLTQIGYTRAAERRADQTAIRILRKAEISPKGLSEFFRRLSRNADKPNAEKPGTSGSTQPKLPDLDVFSTHPPSEDRAKLFDGLAPYATTAALTPEQWAALKAICDK